MTMNLFLCIYDFSDKLVHQFSQYLSILHTKIFHLFFWCHLPSIFSPLPGQRFGRFYIYLGLTEKSLLEPSVLLAQGESLIDWIAARRKALRPSPAYECSEAVSVSGSAMVVCSSAANASSVEEHGSSCLAERQIA